MAKSGVRIRGINIIRSRMLVLMMIWFALLNFKRRIRLSWHSEEVTCQRFLGTKPYLRDSVPTYYLQSFLFLSTSVEKLMGHWNDNYEQLSELLCGADADASPYRHNTGRLPNGALTPAQSRRPSSCCLPKRGTPSKHVSLCRRLRRERVPKYLAVLLVQTGMVDRGIWSLIVRRRVLCRGWR